jgi:hypothetical protein
MSRATYLARILAVTLLVAGVAAGQEQALERVKSESTRLRKAAPASGSDFWKELKSVRERSAGFHMAVRDWIETLLPKSRATLDAEFPFLNPRVSADLLRAGLIAPEWVGNDEFKPGLVTRVELSRPPEDPDKLTVTVGVGVPCCQDDAAYIYDYGQGERRCVLESHGTRDHDDSLSDIHFSGRNAIGSQLILTLRHAVQCGSSWSVLSYDLFRLSPTANTAVPILGGEHGIWFGADDPFQIHLEPDELLMEVRDRSVDAGIHNRAHVLHYNAAKSPVERIDPVALQPQDFVDEWLTQPWSEMESRSAESARDKLKKWHEFLAGDFVAGDFTIVQVCSETPNKWQIGMDLAWIKGNELPDALSVYFLVQQSDQYRFKMIAINFDRQEGCPGESPPSAESPSLFPIRKHER